ncbi:hypothetical protein V6N12_065773 [Hibiscus sabdariffa]|uniref:Uncharacterized protein n=1 Tax=Hibiscus sabdariffa TaxID=183260 RepID=A0ABR2G9P1_9ROSI
MANSENLGNPTVPHSMAPVGRPPDSRVVGVSSESEGVNRQIVGLAPVAAGEDMLLDAGDLHVVVDGGDPVQSSMMAMGVEGSPEIWCVLEKVAPKLVPTTYEMYGPWMQVERQHRRSATVSRDVLPAMGNSHTVGGSRLAALANVEDAKGLNGGKTDASSVAPAILVEPMLQESTPLVENPVQSASRPSSKHKLVENVSARGSLGKDTVVVAPTSLPADKHKAIQVVEEGSKKVLHDNNGHAMYGPILNVYSKGASRNVNLAAGLSRKNGKLKKSMVLAKRQLRFRSGFKMSLLTSRLFHLRRWWRTEQ